MLYASPSADSGNQANSRVEAIPGDEVLEDPCDDGDGCVDVPLSLPFPDSSFG